MRPTLNVWIERRTGDTWSECGEITADVVQHTGSLLGPLVHG
jgi:hypothetical protein